MSLGDKDKLCVIGIAMKTNPVFLDDISQWDIIQIEQDKSQNGALRIPTPLILVLDEKWSPMETKKVSARQIIPEPV